MMKHRDRVAMALAHETPDRCPMQISFTPEFSDRLKQEIFHKSDKAHNPHGGGNTYDLERVLGEDILLTSVGWANNYYQTFEPGAEYKDEWGIGWKAAPYETRFGPGIYTEFVSHPLAEDRAIDTYVPPDPNDPALYRDAEALIKNYRDEYWITGVTVTTIWETAWALRGLEQMIMDLIVNPELANRILDIPFKYHLTAARKLVHMGVDMIWLGDDVGTQQGMLLSPDMWRSIFKPRMAEFIGSLKAINPALKVAYHSCGDIAPIIGDLVEIGLDVLNPIQPACLDLVHLKATYGDKLCFWGSIDEQHTLPFGSPDDVRTEVASRIEVLGKNGGLILGPTHHVQLDTPLENFWAMVEAITGVARAGSPGT
jgi:uroporphyrinogen decarboxylase